MCRAGAANPLCHSGVIQSYKVTSSGASGRKRVKLLYSLSEQWLCAFGVHSYQFVGVEVEQLQDRGSHPHPIPPLGPVTEILQLLAANALLSRIKSPAVQQIKKMLFGAVQRLPPERVKAATLMKWRLVTLLCTLDIF